MASLVASQLDSTSGVEGTGRATPAPMAPALHVEVRRKLLHMLPGILPFVFASIPHRDPLSPLAREIVFVSALLLTLVVLLSRRRIARAGETGWLARVLSYPATVLLALVAFPAHAEFAAVVVVVLAFGDGAASLGGHVLPGRPLPWNRGKTLAGSLCFLICAAPLAVVAYWREAQPAVGFVEAFVCGTAAALAGAVAEGVDSRINDNLRVGLSAFITVAAAHWLFTSSL